MTPCQIPNFRFCYLVMYYGVYTFTAVMFVVSPFSCTIENNKLSVFVSNTNAMWIINIQESKANPPAIFDVIM